VRRTRSSYIQHYFSAILYSAFAWPLMSPFGWASPIARSMLGILGEKAFSWPMSSGDWCGVVSSSAEMLVGLERPERAVASASSFRRASSSRSNLVTHCERPAYSRVRSGTYLRPKTSM
jgi:hypothetical protein